MLKTNSFHAFNDLTVLSFKRVAELAVSSPRCGARCAKQRKVSSVCDSGKAESEPPQKTKPSESEQQPDIKDEEHIPGGTGQKYVLFLNMWLFQIVNKKLYQIPLSFYIFLMCFSRKGTKSVQSW